jgi:predicted cupin superfamily sugar epimerase
MADAKDIIEALNLHPHPEGGHFVETWRHEPEDTSRGAGTAIYFLLRRGERSRWHRIDSSEIWHFYAGSPLTLSIATDSGSTDHDLGPDILAGQRPQIEVAPMAWQAAESQGDWTLVGCTVSPAFDFDHFEMAEPGWEPQ